MIRMGEITDTQGDNCLQRRRASFLSCAHLLHFLRSASMNSDPQNKTFEGADTGAIESFFQENVFWGLESQFFRDTVNKYHVVSKRQAIYNSGPRSCYYKCRNESCPFYLRLGFFRNGEIGWYITKYLPHNCPENPHSPHRPTQSLTRKKLGT